jgi:hypothetical protein
MRNGNPRASLASCTKSMRKWENLILYERWKHWGEKQGLSFQSDKGRIVLIEWKIIIIIKRKYLYVMSCKELKKTIRTTYAWVAHNLSKVVFVNENYFFLLKTTEKKNLSYMVTVTKTHSLLMAWCTYFQSFKWALWPSCR